jgi:chromosome segregation ATPase
MHRKNPPVTPILDESTLTKDELEKIELRLKIAKLRRPWWQESSYAVNGLIALCSIVVLFVTGQFQANSLKNQAERVSLDQQRKEFEQQARDFDSKRNSLYQDIERLTNERNESQRQALETRNRLASYEAEASEAKNTQELLTSLTILKNSEKFRQQAFANIKKTQLGKIDFALLPQPSLLQFKTSKPRFPTLDESIRKRLKEIQLNGK